MTSYNIINNENTANYGSNLTSIVGTNGKRGVEF